MEMWEEAAKTDGNDLFYEPSERTLEKVKMRKNKEKPKGD